MELGLDAADYGTHFMLRLAMLIQSPTKNLRTTQSPPGHFKRQSTVRYIGIAVDDAVEIGEQTGIGKKRTDGR
jgi:hypothetical protein